MKKWLIVMLIIAIFAVSVLIGFLISSFDNFSKKEEGRTAVLAEEEIQNEVLDTSVSEKLVSPNAQVVITQNYKKCGHASTTTEIVPREIVNLNEEKVREYYSEWEVEQFSTDEIKISKVNSGICKEHYIIRESDGFLSINCKNDIGEYIFKGLTDISVQYLPEEDLERLHKGIEIVGRENLNKFLEDFE